MNEGEREGEREGGRALSGGVTKSSQSAWWN